MRRNSLRVLVIGGLTKDVIKRREVKKRAGGGAFYCSVAAARMGARVELWTVVGEDFPLEELKKIEAEGIKVSKVNSKYSIGFVNEIDETGQRRQYVSSVADLCINEPLGQIEDFDFIQITPVLGEVSMNLISLAPPGITAIELQGFVRKKEAGPVKMVRWPDWSGIINGKLLIHLSDEELLYFTDSTIPHEISKYHPRTLALTRAARGAFIFSEQINYFIPAPEISVFEDVGCGDVFSVVMGMSLMEGDDLLESAFKATTAATLLAESSQLEKLRVGREFDERLSIVRQIYNDYGLSSPNILY